MQKPRTLPKQCATANKASQDTKTNGSEIDYDFLHEFLQQEECGNSDEAKDRHTFHICTHGSKLMSNCNNMLHQEDGQFMAIMDGGADTCVIGKGWKIIDQHPTQKTNVIGFAVSSWKNDLPIVLAVRILRRDLPIVYGLDSLVLNAVIMLYLSCSVNS